MYYYNSAKEVTNYETFKEYHSESYKKQPFEGYFNLDDLKKEFKGYEPNELYYVEKMKLRRLFQYFENTIFRFTDPYYDHKTKLINYYKSADDRENEKRTSMKPGRFFRKIAPFYNDTQIEFLVNILKEEFDVEGELASTESREGIKGIYTAKTVGGGHLSKFKCINASCMRYDNFGKYHPSEVYASGDFTLFYIENAQGLIAARVLYCKENGCCGPIYASSDAYGNLLMEKLKEEHGITYDIDYDNGTWEGAKLLKIEESVGNIIGPYIDMEQNVADYGDYLRIDSDSTDYSFNSTGGIYHKRCSCEMCGWSSRADNFVEIDGEMYCLDCHYYCDFSEEYRIGNYDNYTRVRVSIGRTEIWSNEYLEENAVEFRNHWLSKEFYESHYANKEQPKEYIPKVGDRVRIISNDGMSNGCTLTNYFDIGETGCITSVREHNVEILCGTLRQIVAMSDFEIMEDDEDSLVDLAAIEYEEIV